MILETKEIEVPWAQTLLARQNKDIYPELFIHYGPDKTFLPKHFGHLYYQIDNLEVNNDDLWICSFIKAGSYETFMLLSVSIKVYQ
jgi:hypothetical protein